MIPMNGDFLLCHCPYCIFAIIWFPKSTSVVSFSTVFVYYWIYFTSSAHVHLYFSTSFTSLYFYQALSSMKFADCPHPVHLLCVKFSDLSRLFMIPSSKGIIQKQIEIL